MTTPAALDRTESERILAALKEARTRLEAAERAIAEPIAVIGIGCRFPGEVDGPAAYWRLVSAGVDAVGPIPPERYDTAALFDPAPAVPGRIYVRDAALLADIDRFDAAFFDISPREAASLDPQQRLLLEVAQEALEHGGLAPERLRGSRTGVFVGIGRSDYGYRLLTAPPDTLTAWHATGNGLCYGPGRLGHVFDFRGPNLVVDTACSSSLVAVHLACQSLRLRECDLALTGGCHVHLSPRVTMMLCMSGALAPDGRCKTFDAAADGFGQGEGCGLVVLRRLSDALTRGDNILALIRGSAVGHDGHSSGLTVPSPAAQEQVIRDALANARVAPRDLGYVEAHGTGTLLGDPIEVEALAAVFGRDRPRDDPLRIGSVKTNLGHLEAAAGIAGLIKVVLALGQGEIPPHLHLRQPNPRIPWDALPIAVPTCRTPWERGATARLAGVSSFGMSGTNSHVILQEAPLPPPTAAGADRPLHLVTVSARSPAALRRQAGRLAAHLGAHPELTPGDLAHTLNTGRNHYAVRAARVAADHADLLRHWSALAAGTDAPARLPEEDTQPPAPVFLFSGQGAQYPDMGRGLYETHPGFRRLLDQCDGLLRPLLGDSLLEVLFSGDGRLDQTRYTQPALFALEWALAQLWRSFGVVPQAVLGHSLGDYAAACVAGVFSLEDGLRLVTERARLMQERPAGGMAAVAAAEERVRQILEGCGGEVTVAAVNAPASVTIAGPAAALAAALARCAEAGLATRTLKVSHAFHSPMMEPVLAPFAAAARQATFGAPRLGLVSNLTGDLHCAAPTADYWTRHLRQPVRFAAGVATLLRRGARVFVEIGPGSTLLGLVGRQLGEQSAVLLPSLLAGQAEWQTLLSALGRLYELGVAIDWAGVDRDGPRRRPVPLPTYPFERQRHWCEEPAAAAAAPPRQVPAYRLRWCEWAVPAGPHPGAAAGRRRWVLFAERDDLGDRLATLLAGLGAEVLRVYPGERCAREGAGSWTVAPTSAADLGQLLRELPPSPAATGILYLWSAAAGSVQEPDVERLEAAQLRAGVGLLHLVQALAAAADAGTRLWAVTRNAVADACGEALPALDCACVWGLGRVIALEYPGLWGGLIDLSAQPGDAELAQFPAILAAGGDEDQVLLRGERRYRARLEPLAAPPAPARRPVRADGSYLITGGLGALGLRVARWLADQGAGALVLVGRHEPGPAQRQRLADLRETGTTVRVLAADVAEPGDLERVFAVIAAELPPLRGLVHAAGLPGEQALADLDAAALGAVLRPKVRGAWLLHRLTAHLELDWFVAFSSVAALWGSKGQAHYAAANAFLDALADYRQRRGLPALSIAWGPWSGGGMADAGARERLARVGVRALDPAAALAALASHLHGEAARIALADVDWACLREPYESGRRRPLLESLWPAPAAPAPAPAGAPLTPQFDRLTDPERREWLVAHLEREVAAILGLAAGERPDPRKGFARLGMDSLMAIELKDRLARGLGVALASTLAFDYPNIAALAAYLADQVLGWGAAGTEPAAATGSAVPEPAADAPPATLAEKLARLESLISET